MRFRIAISLVLAAAIWSCQAAAYAGETYPQFSEAYWKDQQQKATGKILRGSGLAVLGLAALVPTAIWTDRAFENPYKFAALGVVASIATIGMTLHGVNSIGFGLEQKRRASSFVEIYRNQPEEINVQEERDFYLYSAKKSTAKVILFGGVLTLQSAVLLANGLYLGLRKHSGQPIGGAKLWPSFVFGGVMLAAGVSLMIIKAKQYKSLMQLQGEPIPIGHSASVQPYFYRDPVSGRSVWGLSGQMSF